MSACKMLFFLLLALFVLCGTCNVLYGQVGSSVSMDCEVASNSDVEWKFESKRIIYIRGKSGGKLKGQAHMAGKVAPNGGILKIPNLEPRDSGIYSCNNKEFSVHVVSVSVKPGLVLAQSTNAELNCDITGSPDTKVQWINPNNQTHDIQNQKLQLKSVTSVDEGGWMCVINNLKLTITLTVVALQTQDVAVSEGDVVVLPCSFSRPVSQRVVGGKWKTDNLLKDFFPNLRRTDGKSLQWNGENSSRVTFTSGLLSTNYDVTLINVQPEDQGMYECTVELEGGVKLNAMMNLTVLPKTSSNTGGTIKNVVTRTVLGMQLWIWIAIGASLVVLIGLFVIALLVHQRNKRMNKRVRKMRSLRQPLTAKDYCHCHRNKTQLEHETPLAVPRQHRNSRPAKNPHHTSDRTGLVY